MVAVPEVCASAPTSESGSGRLSLLAHCRRMVAVVDTTVELLRPESDLLQMISAVDRIDILVALDDTPAISPGRVGLLSPELQLPTGADPAEPDPDDDADTFRAEVQAEVDGLGLPGLRIHHLGLSAPLGPRAEADLVAALSELVGFDPEPGVYCLAPASAATTDPGRTVLSAAARRIAQVYGLPLLRYRGLELAVVSGPRSADGD